jgi:heat shock protein HspQ
LNFFCSGLSNQYRVGQEGFKVIELGRAQFNVGQLIHHKLFNYRGVVVDVDPEFEHSDAWYDVMAQSKPDKHQPWYHILVDGTDYMTYVAEQNLEEDNDGSPISHPDLHVYLEERDPGHYSTKKQSN